MFFSKKICSKANQESTWMIWSKVTRLHQRCAGSLLLRRYLSPRTPRRPVRCWCSGTESNRQGWQRAESQTSWQVMRATWREGLSRHLHKAERHQQHQHSETTGNVSFHVVQNVRDKTCFSFYCGSLRRNILQKIGTKNCGTIHEIEIFFPPLSLNIGGWAGKKKVASRNEKEIKGWWVYCHKSMYEIVKKLIKYCSTKSDC